METKRVIIIGAGFGGVAAARMLAGSGLDVLMVDRQNYHLFQPLLYQVATAGLEIEAIAYPVRALARRFRDVGFRLAEVTAIDLNGRTLHTTTGPIRYDYLVLAAGAATNFFGQSSIAASAYQLKDLDDAVTLRNHILTRFERAAVEPDPATRRALLTFMIVGGGPTGIEFAGALSELIRQVLLKDYPEIRPQDIRVILAEATDRLLPAMPPALGTYAVKRLQSLGVEVMLNATVEAADASTVRLKGGESIPCHTLLWSAGVKAAPLADTLEAPKGRAGRIIVEPDLSLASHPEVFVVGDISYLEQDGNALPTIAPVAMQQGEYAARAIRAREQGQALSPFRYIDRGSMAVIGRGKAVASVFGVSFTGLAAWLLWLGLHLFMLIDFRNRIITLINWAYDYFFFDRKVRLIMRETDSSALPGIRAGQEPA